MQPRVVFFLWAPGGLSRWEGRNQATHFVTQPWQHGFIIDLVFTSGTHGRHNWHTRQADRWRQQVSSQLTNQSGFQPRDGWVPFQIPEKESPMKGDSSLGAGHASIQALCQTPKRYALVAPPKFGRQ